MGEFIEDNVVVRAPRIFGCSLRSLSVSAPSTSGSLGSITVEVVQDLENGDRFTLLEIPPTLLSLQVYDLSLEALNIRGVIKGYDYTEIDIGGTGVFSVYLEEESTYNRFINWNVPSIGGLVSLHNENNEIITLKRGYSIVKGATEFHKVTEESLFLLVAGLPQTNVKRAVQISEDDIIKTEEGVNQIMVQFDVNGVKTRYSKNFNPNSDEEKLNELEEDVDELIDSEDNRKRYEWERPTGGLGVIVSNSGPFYNIRRINGIDFDKFSSIGVPQIVGFPEWRDTRNLAEPLNSPGYLANGTTVTVNIYNLGEGTSSGPYVPYIEVAPTLFAPPV
jgi:hypothetical protein